MKRRKDERGMGLKEVGRGRDGDWRLEGWGSIRNGCKGRMGLEDGCRGGDMVLKDEGPVYGREEFKVQFTGRI